MLGATLAEFLRNRPRVLALLSLLALQTPAPLEGEPAARSVLVVIADDFGWSERALMPSLDELARRGVTFERAYSWPLCSPTREAVWHGNYPRRTGVGDTVRAHNGELQAGESFSLAEALAPRRKTALYHLGRAPSQPDVLTSGPPADGIEHWLAGTPESINRPHANAGYHDWYRVDDGQENPHADVYATDAQREAFLGWWGNRPQFAVLAWSAPHAPYDVPPGGTPRTGARANYEQTIAYLDRSMAAVLATIDWERTLVVFLGDNGTPNDARPSGSAPGRWKNTTFEGGIRVPLIVAGAGVTRAGVTSARLVSMVDLAATVLELTRTPQGPNFVDSRSFADELGPWTGTPPREFVLSERYPTPDDLALVTTRWKLRLIDPDGPGPQPTTRQLYDLASDPGETRPLDPDAHPAERDRLLTYLASLPPRL